MKIGLISDTHLPAMGDEPPPEVAAAFEGVDLILHAGDIYSSACLDWLELIAPVVAIRGVNEVVPGVIAAKFPPERSLAGAVEDFFGSPVETVVFGHTHFPMVETNQGILFVNPGSPTLPKMIRRLGTVGILELTSEGQNARIVDLTTVGE
jgi:predicted phosphodiesterase